MSDADMRTRWLYAHRMRFGVAVLGLSVAACGQEPAIPPLTAGPVSIDPATMTLTIASLPAMVQEKFLGVHTVERVIETTYYDPLDAHDVSSSSVTTCWSRR